MELCCLNWNDILAAGLAIVTVILSFYEYKLHKDRERSKVFSSLNIRYLESKDVQTVVRYLHMTGKEQEHAVPNSYQTEVFLRFFEELGVYLKSKSLQPHPVEQLFGYYIRQIFISEKGKALLEACEYKDKEWPYVVIFKDYMRAVNPDDWKDI